MATLWTRWVLTSETNGDVRTPWVQTRGGTGELLPTNAALIQSEARLKLDFEQRLTPNLIDGFVV